MTLLDNNLNENGALAGTIRFPLANVERIEIVSGPASALYRANAFNGIINIITKDVKSIQYSLGGYYYKIEGPYFGGISNLQESGYQRRINQNSLEYYAQNQFCGGVCIAQNIDRI